MAAARNFGNKLWNSARFVLMKVGPRKVRRPHPLDRDMYALEDRWILSRLEQLEIDVDLSLKAYQLGEAARSIEEFLRNEFCDWYIEMTKVRLTAGDERPLAVLLHVLDHGLRMLHPFMPFVTEELWQAVRERVEGDMASQLIWFPRSGANWKDATAEARWTVDLTARSAASARRRSWRRARPVVTCATGYAAALRNAPGHGSTNRQHRCRGGPGRPVTPDRVADTDRGGDPAVDVAVRRAARRWQAASHGTPGLRTRTSAPRRQPTSSAACNRHWPTRGCAQMVCRSGWLRCRPLVTGLATALSEPHRANAAPCPNRGNGLSSQSVHPFAKR
jgi:valyl-tRNA synthetase